MANPVTYREANRASASQTLLSLSLGNSQQPKTVQKISRVEGYPSGDLTGLLQLLDIVVKSWMGKRYFPRLPSLLIPCLILTPFNGH